jgi:hypothetical protein
MSAQKSQAKLKCKRIGKKELGKEKAPTNRLLSIGRESIH